MGLIIGYLFKSSLEKVDLSKPTNLALLLLIFFMGVEAEDIGSSIQGPRSSLSKGQEQLGNKGQYH